MNIGFMNFRIGVLQLAAYRASVAISIFSEIVLVTAFYFLWRAVFASSSSGVLTQWQFTTFFSYLLFARLLSRFVTGSNWGFFYNSVRTGSVLYDLVQPHNLVSVFYWRHFGRRLSEVALILPVVAAALYFVDWDVDVSRIPIFLVSAFFGFTCAFFFEMLVSITAFFTLSQQGIQESKILLVTLLSGSLFPIDLLPDSVAGILNYAPFPHFIYSPVMILTTPTGLSSLLTILLVQLIWIAVLAAVTLVLMKYVRRRFNVQGG